MSGQGRPQQAQRDPLSTNFQYFEDQRLRGLQNYSGEPNAAIHLFDSHGARVLENNPLIIYRTVFRSFLVKVFVHRSRDIIAPPDCVRNEGYIDLIGPSGSVHRISARLGPTGTVILQDLSEPGSQLLEAVSGMWFSEGDLQEVESHEYAERCGREFKFYPGVDGRQITSAEGITTYWQQPAVRLTGHLQEADAYEALFADTTHNIEYPAIMQPYSLPPDEICGSAGQHTPANHQAGPSSSSGMHYSEGTPHGFHAGAHNPCPPQYHQEGAPSGLHAGTNNIGPPQYFPARQPLYNPNPCTASGPAIRCVPRYVQRPVARNIVGRFLGPHTLQNRLGRANRAKSLACKVERGIKRGMDEIKRKEFLEKKVLENEVEYLEKDQEKTREYYTADPLRREISAVKENEKKNKKLKQTSLTLEAIVERDGDDTDPDILRMRIKVLERENEVRKLENLKAEQRLLDASKYSKDDKVRARDIEREKEWMEHEENRGYRCIRTNQPSKMQGVTKEKIIYPPDLKEASKKVERPSTPCDPDEVDLLKEDSGDDMLT